MYTGGKTYIMLFHYAKIDNYDDVLQYMYYPAINTLMKMLPLIYNNVEIILRARGENYDNLVEGDTLIWIGIYNPDFSEFKKRNIYTIHLNLEPSLEDYGSDEIWTYSLHMYNEYKNSNLIKNKIIKFIPIIHYETECLTKYYENNIPLQLAFFGNLLFRRDKQELLRLSGVNVYEIYHLWTEPEFIEFISNNTHIYLNLTKGSTKALAALRLNKLLSHKCIIISETTNDEDEQLYKDIVFFKDINEIGSFYKSLIELPKSELEIIAESCYQKFINKFKLENAINLIQTCEIEIATSEL